MQSADITPIALWRPWPRLLCCPPRWGGDDKARNPSLRRRLQACVALTGLFTLVPAAFAAPPPQTSTPIKHLIVIYGENRSFDHLFAT
jgi:hypothetical protein